MIHCCVPYNFTELLTNFWFVFFYPSITEKQLSSNMNSQWHSHASYYEQLIAYLHVKLAVPADVKLSMENMRMYLNKFRDLSGFALLYMLHKFVCPLPFISYWFWKPKCKGSMTGKLMSSVILRSLRKQIKNRCTYNNNYTCYDSTLSCWRWVHAYMLLKSSSLTLFLFLFF